MPDWILIDRWSDPKHPDAIYWLRVLLRVGGDTAKVPHTTRQRGVVERTMNDFCAVQTVSAIKRTSRITTRRGRGASKAEMTDNNAR